MRTVREISEMLGLLTQDERAAIEIILERVTEGRISYGGLIEATDPRNFVEESLHEFIDGAFYLAVQTHRLRQNPRVQPPSESMYVEEEGEAELAELAEGTPSPDVVTSAIPAPEPWSTLVEVIKRKNGI
jgi:hypothetical protein